MENIIEVKNFYKSYGKRQVLKDMNFSVKVGTIHGLLGPNGAGKTTTMKCLIGLQRGEAGELFIESFDCTQRYNPCISVGYLLEQPPLFEDLYVEEYLHYMGKIQGVQESSIDERVKLVSEKLGLLDVAKRRIGNLSKGYKQRLGIAQAIIHDPKIVILDEPTLGLDPQTVIEMRNLILELKKEHTVLVSSHQLHEMGIICDEITILLDGRVVQSGRKEEISAKLQNNRNFKLILKGEVDKFLSSLAEVKWIHSLETNVIEEETHLIFSISGEKDRRAEVVKLAVENNCDVLHFVENSKSLEEIFIDVTGKA